MGLLTLTEIAFFLTTIQYSQLRGLPTESGTVFAPGFSRPKQVVYTWLYYFFQTMGRGLFPLLVYWAMIGVAWGRPVDKRVPRVARKRSVPLRERAALPALLRGCGSSVSAEGPGGAPP